MRDVVDEGEGARAVAKDDDHEREADDVVHGCSEEEHGEANGVGRERGGEVGAPIVGQDLVPIGDDPEGELDERATCDEDEEASSAR